VIAGLDFARFAMTDLAAATCFDCGLRVGSRTCNELRRDAGLPAITPGIGNGSPSPDAVGRNGYVAG
jgi:hypothetical protein